MSNVSEVMNENSESTDNQVEKCNDSENLTNVQSKSIKAIDKQTVHRICSGQVVLDLATAVKELVENSIDAGANNIEIRLKEYGKELIEVSDNGQGIKEEDFEFLALKHYTSKLREFNELPSVNTFGFRGEALSSLSALSDLTVITQNDHAEAGSKLVFDHKGKLVDRCLTARAQGTTVSISNLFYLLPVRHKEFHRNYKKDFSRLMNILYAFCLVNSSVRINCVNQVGSKKNKVISTNGNNSVLDVISTIFGVNQVKNLIKIEQSEPLDTVLEEYNTSKDVFVEYGDIFTIEGYISSGTHGCGRSVTDRQFFFINNRPCDFPKLARIVNEVYHSYNNQQYPFVFLNMTLKKDYVDVNVTPDKRKILIQQENILLVVVKSTLKSIFDQNATFFAENIGLSRSNKSEESLNCNEKTDFPKPTLLDKFKNPKVLTGIDSNAPSRLGNLLNNSVLNKSLNPLDIFQSKYARVSPSTVTKKQKTTEQISLLSFYNVDSNKRKSEDDLFKSPAKKSVFESIGNKRNDEKESLELMGEKVHEVTNESLSNVEEKALKSLVDHENVCINNKAKDTSNDDFIEEILESEKEGKSAEKSDGEEEEVSILDEAPTDINHRPSVTVDFNIERIKKNYNKLASNHRNGGDSKKNDCIFNAKISVSDNDTAEKELGRNVTKDMFNKMEVIGQFNLGFIITKLNDELFIVDQHATDEKYNYETLQQKKCLKGQRLIKPIPMNLTLVNKSVLLDNLGIFEKNGFEFDVKADNLEDNENECVIIESTEINVLEKSNEINASSEISSSKEINNATNTQEESDEPNPPIKLLTVPTSRNWTFSVDDVEELICLLTESPGIMCRPSRVHKMFASRACRKSVMIGTALNKQQMKKLLSHMSEIDHPWNCPHGRPTMRHLINLNRVASM